MTKDTIIDSSWQMGDLPARIDSDSVRNVYKHLSDETSKDIYTYRLMYSITGDWHWVERFALKPEGRAMDMFRHSLDEATDKEHIIYGYGYLVKILLKTFPEYSWDYIVVATQELANQKLVPAISSDELYSDHKDAVVVVCAPAQESRRIVSILLSRGFSEDNIIVFVTILLRTFVEQKVNECQYFDLEALYHDDDEVFVDCGAYDGATSRFFTRWCHKKYSHIYAFEPDKKNFLKCQNVFKRMGSDIDLFNYGVWNKNETLTFKDDLDIKSFISDSGETSIKGMRLDDILRGENITFIKMDVEGAEYQAHSLSESFG